LARYFGIYFAYSHPGRQESRIIYCHTIGLGSLKGIVNTAARIRIQISDTEADELGVRDLSSNCGSATNLPEGIKLFP
jgi:hypothetical protein